MKKKTIFCCIYLLLAGILAEIVLILTFYFKAPSRSSSFIRKNDNNFAKIAFESCYKSSIMKKQHNWWASFFAPPSSPDYKLRNFDDDPIRIGGSDFSHGTWIDDCPVGCVHYPREGKLAPNESGIYFDASFVDRPEYVKTRRFMGMSILRTMESAVYRPSANLAKARASFDVVMTTRLDSDVPMPYFSWQLYDFMKTPRQKRTQNALASGFFSNCDPTNFRQKAVELLLNDDSTHSSTVVEIFGLCSKNQKRVGSDKLNIIGRYKFHLAFENSNEIDYVTEKFFQSLAEGTVPVVIGAPNIDQFAPSNNSFLVIKKLGDVPKIRDRMIDLATNDDNKAYSAMLRWKETGPSVQFKALVDLSIVHSSCRICIHLADKIRQKERQRNHLNKNECECISSSDVGLTKSYRFYVRERGRFDYFEAFLFGWDLNLSSLRQAILTAFQNSGGKNYYYWPIWTRQRDEKGRRLAKDQRQRAASLPPLNLYRIYEATATQGEVLFGKKAPINSDKKVALLFEKISHDKNCLRLEVIFV